MSDATEPMTFCIPQDGSKIDRDTPAVPLAIAPNTVKHAAAHEFIAT